ncbi:MAG: PTS sugar transporter subunit IIA [Aerococcus sp.]|nr:PTS sugar transporter subunit IIA [Aerococcus sp.]
MEETPLFYESTVFISSTKTQAELFETVSKMLKEQDLVTEDFYKNLVEREENYPTGMDMTPVNPNYVNIAIPHTEVEYVKTTRIVPIKLENPLTFHNMINPSTTLEVGFAFMILNEDPEGQVNILARIMDFFNRLTEEEAMHFFSLEDAQAIYQFLDEKF